MVKVTLAGVIPTTQYGNLQPTIEAEGDSNELALRAATIEMEKYWNSVCEPGKELHLAQPMESSPTKANSYTKVASWFNGVEVLFDEVAHKYTTLEGEKYVSGSEFCGRYKKPFEKLAIGKKFAAKFNVPDKEVFDMWELNGNTSTSLGTAVHNALELYGKYLDLSMVTKGTNESALHKNEILRPIVLSFFNGREKEDALYEVFIADKDKKRCGFIDRLLIVDREKKICRVQDYKTNPDINKAETILEPFKGVVASTVLGAYWLQLSFYADILKAMGWTVEGLDIYNYEGGSWKYYSTDVVDISIAR